MADPSRSGLIGLESDVSEDAASKSPPPPRNLGKGAGLKPPSGRPEARQEEAPEQAEEGPVLPPPLSYNPDWDKLGDPNFTCSEVAKRPGPQKTLRTGGRGLQLHCSELGQKRLELTSVEQGAFRLRGMTRLRCRAGRGRQEPQARRGFFRARAPASGAVSEPRAYPRSHAARAALPLNKEHLRDPSEVLGTRRGGFSGAVWG